MPKYTSFKNSELKKLKANSVYFSTKSTIVMGILNITDDSFFDGGKYTNAKQIILRCKKMLDKGASIIDIGAQSSRPGAKMVSSEDELIKLLPIIKLLKNKFKNIIISVDTFWSNTAQHCILEGADIINDISAGEIDKNMFNTIANLKVPYIIMHMQGTPLNMQKNPRYKNVTKEVITFFSRKIKQLKSKGISQIIIDPGFGFGKTIQHNYELLNNLDEFKQFNYPILVGLSRKSMIYKILESTPQDALNGTIITNTIALQNGANILRVHDVSEAIECIKISTFAKNNY
tara:strand:+ start:19369 stop:20235 length:867 start_codon:yes stop_codon:yes gene_type:complete